VPAPPKAGGRPADSAREVLASRRDRAASAPPPPPPPPPPEAPAAAPATSAAPGGSRPALGAHRGGRSGGAKPAAATGEQTPAADPTAPEPSDGPTTAPVDAGAGGLPTRDELTLAWGDVVRPKLTQRTRSRWTGRFLEVAADAAVFGLANQITCDRCEEGRPEVEQVLAEHFGRPVRVRLAVDDHSPPPPDSYDEPRSSSTDDDPAEDIEAIGPVHELEDAGSAADGVARLSDAFPGAELVALDENP
jgi:hypothetical protein